MQNCSLSGPLPSSISNITSLRSLNLYGNKLSGSLPPDMCLNMPDLRAFDLGNNQFSGTIPKEFGNCTSLSDLFLRENNLIGIILLFFFKLLACIGMLFLTLYGSWYHLFLFFYKILVLLLCFSYPDESLKHHQVSYQCRLVIFSIWED